MTVKFSYHNHQSFLKGSEFVGMNFGAVFEGQFTVGCFWNDECRISFTRSAFDLCPENLFGYL